MLFERLLDFSWWGLALQLAGAVLMTGFVVAALLSLALKHNLERSRLLVAEGVIACLGLMTAATLLRTIGLRTWPQILTFSLVLALRVLLKKLFVWERKRLLAAGA
jgi:predicted membrane-bound dolichyl-phosphate-mannose-protein mannosyltransferase